MKRDHIKRLITLTSDYIKRLITLTSDYIKRLSFLQKLNLTAKYIAVWPTVRRPTTPKSTVTSPTTAKRTPTRSTPSTWRSAPSPLTPAPKHGMPIRRLRPRNCTDANSKKAPPWTWLPSCIVRDIFFLPSVSRALIWSDLTHHDNCVLHHWLKWVLVFSAKVVCPEGWGEHFSGYCYLPVTNEATWADAQSFCKDNNTGANLVRQFGF